MRTAGGNGFPKWLNTQPLTKRILDMILRLFILKTAKRAGEVAPWLREPGLESQHPHSNSTTVWPAVPGELMSHSASSDNRHTCGAQYTDKQNIHIH